MDASLPDNTQHQAVLAAILYWEFEEFHRVHYVASRVTALDAELFAIRSAITLATQQDNCEKIYIFTDSIALAHQAVDPSIYSGQGHSLAVCRTLAAWFMKTQAVLSPSLKFLRNLNGRFIRRPMTMPRASSHRLAIFQLPRDLLDAFSNTLQLDCITSNSIFLNLSCVIAAFIARIVIMFFSRITSTGEKPTGVLIILRMSSTSWKTTPRCSLSDGPLGSANQLPLVWVLESPDQVTLEKNDQTWD